MKQETVKTITIVALCVGVAILLWFLLHQGKDYDSHAESHAEVIAVRDSFKVREAVVLQRVDSLTASSARKDSLIARLKADKASTQKDLDKTTVQATRFANEIKALNNEDTTQFGRNCDSLADQALNFSYLYNQYKDFSDSLSTVMEQQRADYATALNQQQQLYADLKKNYDQLLTTYQTLFADYTSAKKTMKRERLKTKIAAIIGLIGLGAAALK